MNTHIFDGQLVGLLDGYPSPITDWEHDLTEMDAMIDSLGVNPIIAAQAHTAIRIFAANDGQNYDPLNRLHVKDLVPLVWVFVKRCCDRNSQMLFVEQLADLLSGICPQGRTTRLIQFLAEREIIITLYTGRGRDETIILHSLGCPFNLVSLIIKYLLT